MNNAEFISAQVRFLTEEDDITRTQLVEITEALLQPFIGGSEPTHFQAVSEKIHRMIEALHPERYAPGEDQ